MIRCLVALGCAALACLPMAAAEPPGVPSIDTLISPASYRLPTLSPSGARYAVVLASDATDTLVIVDLATGKSEPAMKTGDGRIVGLWWKGESDLVLLVLRDKGETEFHTFHLGDRESKQPAALRRWWAVLVNTLPEDPERILIATPARTSIIDSPGDTAVFLLSSIQIDLHLSKLNVRTGATEPLSLGSNAIRNWITDRSGRPRALIGRFQERWFMMLETGADGAKRRVELGEKILPDFVPLTLASDGRRIVGMDLASGDTARLVAWDPADDGKEVLLASEDFDAQPLPKALNSGTDLFASQFAGDRPAPRYLDPTLRTLHEQLSQAIPAGTLSFVSSSVDDSKVIALNESERNPGTLYLFDRKTNRLAKLGSLATKLPPEQLGATRPFTCKSRDGLTLRGYLTLPPTATQPPPAVVLVRDIASLARMEFDPFVQILATRGYAVVQIDHRGKRGYGEKFAAAGDLQIAGAMPDDLIDAIDWLGQQRLIDPHRVALHGSYFGGLVAFHAAARYPDRFAALINFHTPMDPTKRDFTEFVFGRYSKDERKAKFGGEGARLDYLKSLDPLAVLPRISVPTFHFYALHRPSRSYFNDGDRLKKKLGPNSARTKFVEGLGYANFNEYETKWNPSVREQWNRVYGEMLAFLEANLGAK